MTTQPHAYDRDPDADRTRADARDDRVRDDRAQDDADTEPAYTDRGAVRAREEEAFGGVKIGSAFFGWLTATGMAVLLTGLVAAAGAVVSLATGTDVAEATEEATETIGIVGAVVLAVILFVAYFCGGYVAGRMARFNGAKQGLAVWLWAVVIAILVAVLGTIAGNEFDVLARTNTLPRIPVNEGDLTTGGIIAAIVVALVSLVGALLGGVTGMRYHRKVDRAGLGD